MLRGEHIPSHGERTEQEFAGRQRASYGLGRGPHALRSNGEGDPSRVRGYDLWRDSPVRVEEELRGPRSELGRCTVQLAEGKAGDVAVAERRRRHGSESRGGVFPGG